MPQVADTVFDLEAFGDQFADAGQRPQLRRISGGQSTRHEHLAQFALLLGIQLAGPAQFAALESISPALRNTPLPAGDRLPGNAQPPRYFRLGHATCKQLAALQSTLLQSFEIALVFHRHSSKQTQAD